MLNFMLIGMAFSATFSNMVSEERLDQIMRSFRPVLGFALIVVILNLGAPLDYHLILGAGLFCIFPWCCWPSPPWAATMMIHVGYDA